MDPKERRVPPGIGPKLPEPEPPAPRRKALGGRETIIMGAAGVLLAVLLTVFIIFFIGSAKTPAQAVAAALDEGFSVQQELVQVSLPGEGERSAYFFISNDQLACAVLQRGAFGYKVLVVSGHLPLAGGGKAGMWMASALDSSEYFVYGMLYEGSAVQVEGEAAVLVDTGQYRCWYYLAEGPMSINSESVVYH